MPDRLTSDDLDEIRKDIKREYLLLRNKTVGFVIGGTIAFLATAGWLGYAATGEAVTATLADFRVQQMTEEFKKDADTARAIADDAFPIGSIIAWHANILNAPDEDYHDPGFTLELRDDGAWLRCDGQLVIRNDYGGLFEDLPKHVKAIKLPNLNKEDNRRFLRGGQRSGDPEEASSISHGLVENDNRDFACLGVSVAPIDNELEPYEVKMSRHEIKPTAGDVTLELLGRYDVRPINMSVVWIIRVK